MGIYADKATERLPNTEKSCANNLFSPEKTNEAQQIFDYITKKVLHYDDVIAGKTAADDITPPPQAAVVGMSLIPGDYYKSKHSAVFQEKTARTFPKPPEKTCRQYENIIIMHGRTEQHRQIADKITARSR